MATSGDECTHRTADGLVRGWGSGSPSATGTTQPVLLSQVSRLLLLANAEGAIRDHDDFMVSPAVE